MQPLLNSDTSLQCEAGQAYLKYSHFHSKLSLLEIKKNIKICMFLVHKIGPIILYLGRILTFLILRALSTFQMSPVASLIHPHILRFLSPETYCICSSYSGSFMLTYEETCWFRASEAWATSKHELGSTVWVLANSVVLSMVPMGSTTNT